MPTSFFKLSVTALIALAIGGAANASATCPGLQTVAESYTFSSLALIRGGGFGLPVPGEAGRKGADAVAKEMCANLVSSQVQSSKAQADVVQVTLTFTNEICQQNLQLANDGRVARDLTAVDCQSK